MTNPAPVLVVSHGAVFRAVRSAMGLVPNVRTRNAVPFLCTPGTPWDLLAADPGMSFHVCLRRRPRFLESFAALQRNSA